MNQYNMFQSYSIQLVNYVKFKITTSSLKVFFSQRQLQPTKFQ